MNIPSQVTLALTPPRQYRSLRPLHLFARTQGQLTGALLVAALLPALLVAHHPLGIAEITAIGTIIAVVFGAKLFRRLTEFPGVPRYSCMMYAFIATHAVILAVFFLFHVDYSPPQFATSFAAASAWFFFVLYVERRMLRPHLLVLPGGDVAGLVDVAEADWHLATRPDTIPGPTTGVVADLRANLDPLWERFLADCAKRGLPIYDFDQVRESVTGRVAVEHLSENALGSLLRSSVYIRVKRLFDILGVVIAAPLAVPLAVLAAILIKLDDGGPILFCQPRMGAQGRTFTMYKFRTMRSDHDFGQHFTEADDPRISRVGRVLRRHRIDELPQLINILKGDMSWIGPRPEAIALAKWYERQIPLYGYRHIVRPGISGWAQVNQGNVAMIEAATIKLQYDLYYIKHLSVWIELIIAARTISVVLSGRGAR